MEFGRMSHRPYLKKEVTGRRSEVGRKSTNPGILSAKRFKSNMSHKDLKKYSTSDSQKQVRDKITTVLIKAGMIRSEGELDFKIMEKNLNSILKTVTYLVQCIYPCFEAKTGNDIHNIAFKVFQYPYEISTHAFTP